MSRPKAAQTWQPGCTTTEEANWANHPTPSGSMSQENPMWQAALRAVAVGRG